MSHIQIGTTAVFNPKVPAFRSISLRNLKIINKESYTVPTTPYKQALRDFSNILLIIEMSRAFRINLLKFLKDNIIK